MREGYRIRCSATGEKGRPEKPSRLLIMADATGVRFLSEEADEADRRKTDDMAAMRKEVHFWLGQAKADMKSAVDLMMAEDFYASVFFSHQTAEKALKALYIKEKKKSIRTHNLVFLARELNAPDNLIDYCAELTPDYITIRYPDAATGAPFETYTKDNAEKHLENAREVLLWARKRIEK